MVTCNKWVLDEHDRVQEILYRYGGGGGGGGGGVGDLHVYLIPVCTYNAYDYSAGYVFGFMKPDNHLPIVL